MVMFSFVFDAEALLQSARRTVGDVSRVRLSVRRARRRVVIDTCALGSLAGRWSSANEQERRIEQDERS
jgi:hypothetical protein